MANIIEIIIKGVDKTSGAFKTSEKATKGLKDALGSMIKVAGGAAAVAVTLKKAFDLGREGGVVLQTAESFEFLLKKLKAAPDLLDQLTKASRGTISEQKLMSGTMTLLAGASGELGTQLANQTPRLLEIAKAANKLNPALGDTAFMYQSIATGVKRASPMILDNLGLTIKIGEANEKYAKQLGKTVDQLTVEEKQLALLNATLEAGDILIEQVGGTTESATDSFDQLTVTLKEMTDGLKAKLYPALNDAAVALQLLLTWGEKVDEAQREHIETVIRSQHTYEEYYAEMVRIGVITEKWGHQIGGLTEAEWELAVATADAEQVIEGMNAAMERYAVRTEIAAGAIEGFKDSVEDLTEAQYLEMAAEALISGDYALAQHFADLAYEAEVSEDRFRDVIAALDALDGRKITVTTIFKTIGVRAGTAAAKEQFKELTTGWTPTPTPTPYVPPPKTRRIGSRRQYGGPVSAGMPYLVGEKGPELFLPNQPGQIEPMGGSAIFPGDSKIIGLLQSISEKPTLDEVKLARLMRDAVLQVIG